MCGGELHQILLRMIRSRTLQVTIPACGPLTSTVTTIDLVIQHTTVMRALTARMLALCRHQVFVDMVREQAPARESPPSEYPMQRLPSDSNRPRDIPVYDKDLSAQW